ncbi:hypothetical protein LXG23DRAFT_16568 [Yarrowia lipolytica]|jgi:hypothetical protein|uniref:Uncharacterized protein n=1 Tax=Yarrowia lipolytica TaxID=4952 RepID=A0A1D8NIF7_YARLL|nr:hypothetical protein YALI1_E17201g [Yarrowia lipolytica]KAB8282094.1 hypothetical protein BKA91DRAFT_139157 [Yarrowia lipolytica]KAE8171140.1 hypothetical protein BKA90DRAFT_139632 [Yarrowia lipolytica]KAJ8056912.1 hypothetical protein LXG23DRAFT_16568 [Yarrowia lipolytica]RMI94549.1 hypothetical protein BD777DRAFT_131647 [Yarrowia lipolytica]
MNIIPRQPRTPTRKSCSGTATPTPRRRVRDEVEEDEVVLSGENVKEITKRLKGHSQRRTHACITQIPRYISQGSVYSIRQVPLTFECEVGYFGPHSDVMDSDTTILKLRDISSELGFLFFLDDQMEPNIRQQLEKCWAVLQTQLGATVVAVTTDAHATQNDYSIPLICDHTVALARAFRALHPMGGGRMLLDAIAMIDRATNKIYFAPLSLGNSTAQVSLRCEDVMAFVEYIWSER